MFKEGAVGATAGCPHNHFSPYVIMAKIKVSSRAKHVDEMALKGLKTESTHKVPKQVQQMAHQVSRKEVITKAYRPRSRAVHLKDMTTGIHPAIRNQINMLSTMAN